MCSETGRPCSCRNNRANSAVHGLAAKRNGDLIALAEQSFDLLITSDQNIQYQQNLQGRNIAILLLPTNRWPILSLHLDEIRDAVLRINSKEFLELTFEE